MLEAVIKEGLLPMSNWNSTMLDEARLVQFEKYQIMVATLTSEKEKMGQVISNNLIEYQCKYTKMLDEQKLLDDKLDEQEKLMDVMKIRLEKLEQLNVTHMFNAEKKQKEHHELLRRREQSLQMEKYKTSDLQSFLRTKTRLVTDLERKQDRLMFQNRELCHELSETQERNRVANRWRNSERQIERDNTKRRRQNNDQE